MSEPKPDALPLGDIPKKVTDKCVMKPSEARPTVGSTSVHDDSGVGDSRA